MKINKKLFTMVSFIGDLVLLLILMFAGGWSPFFALVFAHAFMWLVRLSWINLHMLLFILRRLVHMIPIVLAVVAMGFFLIQLAPGDPLTQLVLNPNVDPADVERMREAFGLDLPWYQQFFKYLFNILRGDFGYSQVFKVPVFSLVSQRAGNTILLALTSLILAWGFSIPAGVTAAVKQYKWQDQLLSFLAFFGLSLPNFFLAFLLLYMVSSTGNWLPMGGMYSVDVGSMNGLQKFIDLLWHMILPVFVIAASVTASLTRVMRANMLEVMGQQYITTARAKGLKKSTVIYKHALRNAINPMITMLGFEIGYILGGSALVEMVLAWPGLGKLILNAILQQDLYLVIGSLVYSVVLLVIGNLLADILLAIVDPRVRIS